MNEELETAKFVIKRKFQKRDYTYEDILSADTLRDITILVTRQEKFSVEWDNTGYNRGRLLKLYHKGKVSYITISETSIEGRNSAFQSVPSALSRFILEENNNKEICFYFLPEISGNYKTNYFMFMYRLMKTASIKFLNDNDYLATTIVPFVSPYDIVLAKDEVRSRNLANKSTYVTTGANNQIQIFGKMYGASKYETTILCVAVSNVANREVELFEIEEGGLTKLPAKSKEAIDTLGNIKIYTTNRTIEREDFVKNNSLRSIQYIYNLLEKLGEKKCAFCNCEIPQIIQGAHIWPVSEIKKQNQLTEDEKLMEGSVGDNGIWLCQNHHKLFDVNLISLQPEGFVRVSRSLTEIDIEFISSVTKHRQIPDKIRTENFNRYLLNRNKDLDLETFITLD
jgi:hypothetical protein